MEILRKDTEPWSCGCSETTLGFPRTCCLGRRTLYLVVQNTNQKPDESGTIEDNYGTINTTV
jgi:hypothetical protein